MQIQPACRALSSLWHEDHACGTGHHACGKEDRACGRKLSKPCLFTEVVLVTFK